MNGTRALAMAQLSVRPSFRRFIRSSVKVSLLFSLPAFVVSVRAVFVVRLRLRLLQRLHLCLVFHMYPSARQVKLV